MPRPPLTLRRTPGHYPRVPFGDQKVPQLISDMLTKCCTNRANSWKLSVHHVFTPCVVYMHTLLFLTHSLCLSASDMTLTPSPIPPSPSLSFVCQSVPMHSESDQVFHYSRFHPAFF
uniref:Uncharacterized protein n=1 Tax=Characodon lateralis TaxID=208331 RepID=A0ABU7DM34_9TELE|nr:hypothetical protein [Characodon lateralis]